LSYLTNDVTKEYQFSTLHAVFPYPRHRITAFEVSSRFCVQQCIKSSWRLFLWYTHATAVWKRIPHIYTIWGIGLIVVWPDNICTLKRTDRETWSWKCLKVFTF